MERFRAVVLRQADGRFSRALEEVDQAALPEGDVLIRVAYSSLNYKDGLALCGRPGVVRKWPMVPGIDLAGTVVSSAAPGFQPGDQVVVTGCGTSETHWGGYAQMARMRSDWVVPVPSGMSLRQAMGVGTAGFTAMQSVLALEAHGLKPGGRPVVVTGAAGGVGSVALAILATRGYRAAASTGRAGLADYLRGLGAAEVIGREALSSQGRPLDTERWDGAIDNVGGDTLGGLLRTMAVGSSIASCGLAGGAQFSAYVYPFILRGVNILGIDSLRCSNSTRRHIWTRLAASLPAEKLDRILTVEPMSNVFELAERILAGKTRGRVVIDVNA